MRNGYGGYLGVGMDLREGLGGYVSEKKGYARWTKRLAMLFGHTYDKLKASNLTLIQGS